MEASTGDRLAAVATALVDARRLGFLGDRPIADVIDHASAFVDALSLLHYEAPSAEGRLTVIDLGSGGGVPGLVIAALRPDLVVTLADRRTKRTDFLARVVRRLGWDEQVSVLAGDLPASAGGRTYSAAVSRGFGPPQAALRTASALVEPGGMIVISEPPPTDPPSAEVDRWTAIDLASVGVRRLTGDAASVPGPPAVACFRRL